MKAFSKHAPLRDLKQVSTSKQPVSSHRGFALISTILVMSFVMLISIAFVSLSNVESKKTSTDAAVLRAQANAKLALQMAIAKLQNHAGSDRRVTARADILANTDPSKKYWTGFWSTENWDPTQPDDRTFLGWGVSDPESNDIANAETPQDTSNSVTLVGRGSVQSDEEMVVMRRMQLENTSTGGGSYAYWIGDEGIKASYHTPQVAENDWNKAALLGIAAKSGVSALNITGYEALTEQMLSNGAISRNSMGIPLQQLKLPVQYFHDITPQAINLLTDTRLGGFKRDLSTAFELPLDDFNAIEEFHASGEQNKTNFYSELGGPYSAARFYPASNSPDLGYICEVPYSTSSGSFVRGPSWDLTRNFYRLYKKEWEKTPWERSIPNVPSNSFAARGSLPHSYSGNKGGANDKGGDVYGYHISEGHLYSKGTTRIHLVNEGRKKITTGDLQQQRTIPRSPKLTPIVTRFTMALGLVKRNLNNGNWSVAMSMDPYVTISNPYNVPLTFTSIGVFSSKYNPIRITLDYTDTSGAKKTADFNKFLSGNYYTQGSYNLMLDPSQGPYTLQPGEVKVISPAKVNNKSMAFWGITPMRGSFSYSEDSGFYMSQNNSVKPKDGTTVKVKIRGKQPGWAATERLVNYLYHDKNHNGSSRNLFTTLPPRNMFGDEDIIDQPLITNLGVSSQDDKTQPNFITERSINSSQIPSPGSSGFYVAVIDIKMNTLKEKAPSLSLNPRGGAFDSRDWDGSDRSTVQWDYHMHKVDDLSQLQLVADMEGHSHWGEGRTAADGNMHTVLYEVPQLPLTSIAQLQHMDTGVTGSAGSLEIGNSFPHVGLSDLTQISGQRKKANGGFISTETQILTDMAWACNEALWDRYFFSGLNWGDATAARLGVSQNYETQQEMIDALLAADPTKPSASQNPRIQLLTTQLSDSQKEELKDYDKIAQYLAVYGGFNINSTSENAWKALFSCLRDVDVNYIDISGSKKSAQVSNAFSRFMVPTAKSGETFGSFRELSNPEIEELAKAMVKQVKIRGPFMGLSDFVNRRLQDETKDGTDVGATGALQAAIESAGLNDSKWSQKPTAKNLSNVSYNVDSKNQNMSNYAGTSGYLRQADILNSIGSTISARSDTFIVRAYGSATDSAGNIIAEAWCEATVQRSPDWVTNSTEDASRQRPGFTTNLQSPVNNQFEANPDLSETNQAHGRKFYIRDFRWLNEQEI